MRNHVRGEARRRQVLLLHVPIKGKPTCGGSISSMSLTSVRAAAKAKAEAARANPKPRAKPRAKPEQRLGTGPKPPGYAGVGRPTEYTPELAEKIAEQIALRVPMVKICADIGVSEAAVYNWKRKYPEFVELVARAREFRAEARADQIDQ